MNNQWRYFAGGVFLGGVLTLILLYTIQTLPKEAPAAGERTLASAVGPVRLAKGRVGGQARYARYRTPIAMRRDPILVKFRQGMTSRGLRPSPEHLRDRAFFFLLANRLDQAIADLEEAVRIAPGEGALLSDLSALYGERAHAENRPEDYVTALEMTERATAAAPDLPEVVFNRAVALEHLFLYEEAHRAWQRYLMVDNRSQWAEEARKHFTKLAATVSRQSRPELRGLLMQSIAEGDEHAVARLTAEGPQEAREVFEELLLPRWAEATARGQKEKADQRMKGARKIAEALARRGYGPIFEKIVAEMEDAAGAPSGDHKTAIFLQSLRQLRTGNDGIEEGRPRQAAQDLTSAERGLGSLQSAAVLMTRFPLAMCQYWLDDHSGARSTLDRLGADPRLADYPSLAAQRQLLFGQILRDEGATTDAVAAYRKALGLFNTLGEKSSAAMMQGLIAESLDSLGRRAEAWRYRYRVFSWASGVSVKQERQFHAAINTMKQAVLAALAQRRPEAALDLQNQLVEWAETLQDPHEEVSALLGRARIQAALGRQEKARQDFGRALTKLPSVPTWLREALAARFATVRSEINDSEDRAAAIAARIQDPEWLGARADFDFRRGDTEAAEKELERALNEWERQRAKVAGSYRASFLDQAQPLYERMVALRLHLAQPEQALAVVERFRARVLLDQFQDLSAWDGSSKRETGSAPLGWSDLQHQVPAQTVIVVYAVIEDRLITWTLRSAGITLSSQQPSWNTISTLIESLPKARVGGRARPILGELYGYLVSPWKHELRRGDRIIFVPTRSLYSVPFAALIDPSSGRFLIEGHALGVSPSASQFLAAMDRDRRISSKPISRVLLAGEPLPDPYGRPFLPQAAGSIQEVERLKEIYHGINIQVLRRKEANPAHLLASLTRSDIVHLAAHAKGDPEDPTHSRLFLSPGADGQGDLTARDVLGLRLTRTRLVMLAACETQAGPISASEGSLGISYAFLAAGVPAVVGSLWQVEDASTARLSIRFHQEIRRGADALSALRTAQLEELSLGQGRSSWTWASFQVFGGVVAREPQNL